MGKSGVGPRQRRSATSGEADAKVSFRDLIVRRLNCGENFAEFAPTFASGMYLDEGANADVASAPGCANDSTTEGRAQRPPAGLVGWPGYKCPARSAKVIIRNSSKNLMMVR